MGLFSTIVPPSEAARLATSVSRIGTRLGISENGRYLINDDGSPFFYLADTAWTLFKRLDHADVDCYFRNRLAKGFSVIQAYVLRGLEVMNLYGDLPLIERDPTKLNERFFQNVDYVVNRANELGLVMGLVATMGEHVKRKEGLERYKNRNEQIFNTENAFIFGELLGARYRKNCVIWLLGGDRTPSPTDVVVWDSMARGLKAGSEGTHLVSYHGGGGLSSSEHFHNHDWLDFNTVQSIHQSADPNYEYIAGDYALTPVKPTLDMEARYEEYADRRFEGTRVYNDEFVPDKRISAFQAREAAYWAVFAGAAGHGYGHNDIWQMNDYRKVDSTKDYSFPRVLPRNNWFTSIDAPGAFGMSYLRRLVELRPWYKAGPDQSVIAAGQGDGEHHAQALRARDGSFILSYLSLGDPVTIHMDRISGSKAAAHWYDPRTGAFASIGSFATEGMREFVPPSGGEGNDWVLVLDDAARGYATA